jgi:hypothetical protein
MKSFSQFIVETKNKDKSKDSGEDKNSENSPKSRGRGRRDRPRGQSSQSKSTQKLDAKSRSRTAQEASLRYPRGADGRFTADAIQNYELERRSFGLIGGRNKNKGQLTNKQINDIRKEVNRIRIAYNRGEKWAVDKFQKIERDLENKYPDPSYKKGGEKPNRQSSKSNQPPSGGQRKPLGAKGQEFIDQQRTNPNNSREYNRAISDRLGNVPDEELVGGPEDGDKNQKGDNRKGSKTRARVQNPKSKGSSNTNNQSLTTSTSNIGGSNPKGQTSKRSKSVNTNVQASRAPASSISGGQFSVGNIDYSKLTPQQREILGTGGPYIKVKPTKGGTKGTKGGSQSPTPKDGGTKGTKGGSQSSTSTQGDSKGSKGTNQKPTSTQGGTKGSQPNPSQRSTPTVRSQSQPQSQPSPGTQSTTNPQRAPFAEPEPPPRLDLDIRPAPETSTTEPGARQSSQTETEKDSKKSNKRKARTIRRGSSSSDSSERSRAGAERRRIRRIASNRRNTTVPGNRSLGKIERLIRSIYNSPIVQGGRFIPGLNKAVTAADMGIITGDTVGRLSRKSRQDAGSRYAKTKTKPGTTVSYSPDYTYGPAVKQLTKQEFDRLKPNEKWKTQTEYDKMKDPNFQTQTQPKTGSAVVDTVVSALDSATSTGTQIGAGILGGLGVTALISQLGKDKNNNKDKNKDKKRRDNKRRRGRLGLPGLDGSSSSIPSVTASVPGIKPYISQI